MQEQTKITILLASVIIVAIISLVFIFYQYGRVQTQFTARISAIRSSGLSVQKYYLTKDFPPKIQMCGKPNCHYDSQYRIGLDVIETDSQDINGQNIKGCHQENTEIEVRSTKGVATQKLKCVSGGWTVS